VENGLRTDLVDRALDGVAVAHISHDQRAPPYELAMPRREIVERNGFEALFVKCFTDMAADIAGAAGY
jgi:hypothetical protein